MLRYNCLFNYLGCRYYGILNFLGQSIIYNVIWVLGLVIFG